MNAGRLALGRPGRALLLGWAAAIAAPTALGAQVGLTSGLAQVSLVVHAAPRGSIDAVGGPLEPASTGPVQEISVPVRLSANSGYSLRVIRTDAEAPDSRVWVRSERGEFRLLEVAGVAVVVARGTYPAQAREVRVLYRFQATGSDRPAVPPVLYELAISPQL